MKIFEPWLINKEFGSPQIARISYQLLVGGLKHFLFFHNIWDVILPIDELHHFSRWFLHHQPD